MEQIMHQMGILTSNEEQLMIQDDINLLHENELIHTDDTNEDINAVTIDVGYEPVSADEEDEKPADPIYEPISSDEEDPFPLPTRQPNPLSAEERKKIHNQTCTRKQRQRYYKHQITIRNFDRRFKLSHVKQILKYHRIPVTAVLPKIEHDTGDSLLFIGIRDPEKIDRYERITRHLFTTHHYNRIFHRTSRPKPNHYRSNSDHHLQSRSTTRRR